MPDSPLLRAQSGSNDPFPGVSAPFNPSKCGRPGRKQEATRQITGRLGSLAPRGLVPCHCNRRPSAAPVHRLHAAATEYRAKLPAAGSACTVAQPAGGSGCSVAAARHAPLVRISLIQVGRQCFRNWVGGLERSPQGERFRQPYEPAAAAASCLRLLLALRCAPSQALPCHPCLCCPAQPPTPG